MTFELMEIKPEILKALKEIGIEAPTDIQRKAIPLIKQGKDVIGKSKTGSGKTAAFGIPLLEMIKPGEGVQVLIVSPTRELAVQIAKELEKFSKYIHSSIATVYGGVSLSPQIEKMKKSEIVVGTPGRLLDHLQRRTLNLSKVNCFVLDEADKLVEMGFIEDIERIMSYTPKNKQILLFGATISREIERLKNRHMKNPEIAQAEVFVEEEYLQQYYYNVVPHEKFSLLVHLLKKEKIKSAIIFCSTKATVDIIENNLLSQGLKVTSLHGNMTQNQRLRVMEEFNKGKHKILVASAVAARGLDIKDVSHIFNYDLSKDPQEYIHRVGRTARAGESGKAITLLCEKDHNSFRSIQNRFDVKIQVLPKENFPNIRFQARGVTIRRLPGRGPRRGGFQRGHGPMRKKGFSRRPQGKKFGHGPRKRQ